MLALLLVPEPIPVISVGQAVVLAVIQGLTEFFPVSSTAHLALAPWLLHWQADPGLTFDVALHAGTLLAIVGFFFTTWVRIVRAGLFGAAIDVHTGAPVEAAAAAAQKRLLWLLALATVPGALAGKLFEARIDEQWRNPLIIAAGLIVVAGLMAWADHAGKQALDFERIGVGGALAAGCAQALAVVPGVSRSGITITAGLFAGLTREAAARFSFLMATPIITGAVLLKAHELRKTGIPPGMEAPMIVGVVVSAVVGCAAVALFIRFLRLRSLMPFVWYRIALGLVVIALYAGGFKQF